MTLFFAMADVTLSSAEQFIILISEWMTVRCENVKNQRKNKKEC